MAVGVLATGAHVPARVVTNRELCRDLETTPAWVEQRIGIRTRRWAPPDSCTSDLAAHAVRDLFSHGRVDPRNVSTLVLATSSPDWVQPATACAVQRKTGLDHVAAFDVGAVCSGFVFALCVAEGLVRADPAKGPALVVGADMYSKILDPRDRTTVVFFGDGAGAVVLGQVPDGFGLLGTEISSDASRLDLVGVPAGGTVAPASAGTIAGREHYFRMDGAGVWDYATRALPEITRRAVKKAGLELDDIDLFVLHQANRRLISACLESLEVGEDRTHTTVEHYGNTAAASVPVTLHDAVRAGKVTAGTNIVLAAVGGGMTAAAAVCRWWEPQTGER